MRSIQPDSEEPEPETWTSVWVVTLPWLSVFIT